MNIFGRTAVPALLAIFALLLSACAGNYGSSPEGEGLTRGQVTDLSQYQKVIIEPVSVEFDKRWKPVQVGSHIELSRADRERLQRDIEKIFNESFQQEITRGRLEIVESPGPGVLRITPELVDVYMNAPAPLNQPGGTYTRNVGTVTLHLAFEDAVSGEKVLELHDRVRGRDIGLLRSASPVYNRYELARIFEDWAQVVRQDLFRAP